MPIYEYECKDCEKNFDVLQKFSDPQIKSCPKCNSLNIEKKISVPIVSTKSRTSIAAKSFPGLTGGRSGIDGTRPLTWPGRMLGVKKDD